MTTLKTRARTASGVAARLMLIDLGHFKRINDSFGHEAGDVVLKALRAADAALYAAKGAGRDRVVVGSAERR